MKAKLFSLLAAIALFPVNQATAQTYVTLVATNNGQASLNIPSNTLASVIHVTPTSTFFTSGSGYNISVVINGVTTYYSPTATVNNGTQFVNNTWPIVNGPAVITLNNNLNYYNVLCTIQLTPLNQNVVSNYVPADAIVIPASATGHAQIILESSLDLVNWNAANPGTYGASAGTNRFFRVRAAMTP